MQKETYERIFATIKARKHGVTMLQIFGRVLTYATAFCYIVSLIRCFWKNGWQETAGLVLVPAVSFLAVSIFREHCHAKRPYEIYDFKPLIDKDTKEKSFPSRHVFSIFVIGSVIGQVYPVEGILICLMGVVLAVIRVVAGVHFPRDVIAGAVIGLVCGCAMGIWI